jgi:FAD/FMN-containing dehydrogenase
VFTGADLDAAVADALAARIAAAPTPACRIDFQQTGGALADVGDTDTAFWGRGNEWNIPLNAIWSDPSDGDACLAWARDTVDALSDHTTGVYSVEVRPGCAETESELAAAFGDNRARLQALRGRIDPAGVFSTYPL